MIVDVCIVVSILMFLYKILTEKFVIYFFWALSKHDWKNFLFISRLPIHQNILLLQPVYYVNIINLNELNTTNKTA